MNQCVPNRPASGKAVAVGFRVFPGEESRCAQARELVRTILRDRQSVVDDAELVVSEFFGNGCRHTASGEPGGTLSVSVSARATGLVVVSVTDQGPTRDDRAAGRRILPALEPVAPDSPGQRGLHLVAAVTDEWGHTLTDAGLMVWAVFNLNTVPPLPIPPQRPHTP